MALNYIKSRICFDTNRTRRFEYQNRRRICCSRTRPKPSRNMTEGDAGSRRDSRPANGRLTNAISVSTRGAFSTAAIIAIFIAITKPGCFRASIRSVRGRIAGSEIPLYRIKTLRSH